MTVGENCPLVYGFAQAVSKTAASEANGLGSTPRWASTRSLTIEILKAHTAIKHGLLNQRLRVRVPPVQAWSSP